MVNTWNELHYEYKFYIKICYNKNDMEIKQNTHLYF